MMVAERSKTIVAGSATMYRILWAKLNSRKTLPKKPHVREATLSQ
jgi:hypothetical protein